MHTLSAFVLVALCVTCIVGLNLEDITPIAHRYATRNVGSWSLRDEQPPTNVSISFKILLKQRHLDRLERIFWDVSDPTHHNYGKFFTASEAKALIAPSAIKVFQVLEWLLVHRIPLRDIKIFSDYFKVTASIEKTAALFNTTFSVYETYHENYPYRYVINGPAHIPRELEDIIDFVIGISELTPRKQNPVINEGVNATDNEITPRILKEYYGIPQEYIATNRHNLQGVAAFYDYFSADALRQFERQYGLPHVNVSTYGPAPNCLMAEVPCEGVESNLDVQYITGMGVGVPTAFVAHQESEWILDWAQYVVNMRRPPLVFSISYGFMEVDQCDLGMGCDLYGYDYEQYIKRTNTELQVLGIMGITILVADGDNGAPGHGNSNCPMDNSEEGYCRNGGCEYTSSKCGEVFITKPNQTACIFPMGLNSYECFFLVSGSTSIKHLTRMLNLYSEKNAEKCNSSVDYDEFNNYRLYSECECSEMESLDYGNGINVIPYTYHKKNGPMFSPEYPTSSPYVTSVGATQFLWDGDQIIDEVGCNGMKTGAIIVTGGGFSNFQRQPSYQTHAVNSWLRLNDSLPPAHGFNPKMRGFPDISFNGHLYTVVHDWYDSNNTDPNVCPNCFNISVDGTSASAPALAGMLSLINDKLLNAGKTPLGFINPLLYMMARQRPSAFRDITKGDNKCMAGSMCCEHGYTATTGWDPVSGLGTPVYEEFESFVLRTKGVRLHGNVDI